MKWKSLHNVCATFVCCKLVAVKVVIVVAAAAAVIVVVVVVKATNRKYNIVVAKQQKHRLGPRQMLQAKMKEKSKEKGFGKSGMRQTDYTESA